MKLATLIPAINFGSHNNECIVKEVNYGKWLRKMNIMHRCIRMPMEEGLTSKLVRSQACVMNAQF